MSKTCVACGVTVPEVEPPVPHKAGGAVAPVEDPKTCPNCGKEGTLEEAPQEQDEEDEE